MSNNKDFVSIIVVSYNHASYLQECLDSILQQTYNNWELIIADDASKDNSQQVIQNWLEQNNIHPRLVFHTDNFGLSFTLNECLVLAKGNFIKLFAADDIMHPQLLEKSMLRFREGPSDLGLVYSNAYIINNDSEIDAERTLIEKERPAPSGWILNHLVEKNFIPALSVMLKKEVFDFVGPYRTDIVTEDYDIWIRASRAFQFSYINEVLSYYRVHQSNVSTNYDFASDVVRLLIKNDKDGDFALRIKKLIMDRYYQKKMTPEILKSYSDFLYKDKWLDFCLSVNIPYKIFRILDKIISN